jgi:hypothetical protein
LNQRLTDVEGTGGPQFRLSGPGSEGTVHEMTVELGSLQIVVLEQNVPNPFAEQTTISYFIPEEQEGAAQILFFDHTGKNIKTADVQKGHGILTVFAPNLSSGTYSYALSVGGKVEATKRMVRAK